MSSNLYSGPTSGLGLTLLSMGNPAMLCMTGFVQTAAVTLRGAFLQAIGFHEPRQLADWILYFYQQERRWGYEVIIFFSGRGPKKIGHRKLGNHRQGFNKDQ